MKPKMYFTTYSLITDQISKTEFILKKARNNKINQCSINESL